MEKGFFWEVALNVYEFNQNKLCIFLLLRIEMAHNISEWQLKTKQTDWKILLSSHILNLPDRILRILSYM